MASCRESSHILFESFWDNDYSLRGIDCAVLCRAVPGDLYTKCGYYFMLQVKIREIYVQEFISL